jgi:hypothetical protein
MSKNIEKFVKETIKEIQNGLPKGFEITEDINFEISLQTTFTKEGGLDIKLASGNLEHSRETTHKVSFGVTSKSQNDENNSKNISNFINFVSEGFAAFQKLAMEQKTISNH